MTDNRHLSDAATASIFSISEKAKSDLPSISAVPTASKIKLTDHKNRKEPGSIPARPKTTLPKKPVHAAAQGAQKAVPPPSSDKTDPPKAEPGSKPKSKTEIADKLLCSAAGATRKTLSEKTGWTTVNLRTASGRRPDHVLAQKDDRFRLIAKSDFDPKGEWKKVKL